MAPIFKYRVSTAITSVTKSADRFASWLLLAMAIIMLLYMVAWVGIDSLCETELVFSSLAFIIPAASFIVSRCLVKQGKHSSVKYVVVGTFFAISSLYFVMYEDLAWFSLLIPIFVTSLYYNPRFTICAGVLAYFLDVALSAASLFVPPCPPLGSTFLVDGTAFVFSGDMSLAEQLNFNDAPTDWIDYGTSVIATIVYRLVEGFFGYGTATTICAVAAFFTHKAVEEERKITTEQERVNSELSAAAQLQQQMLSDVSKEFKGQEEVDIWALMDPARKVGGDFYVAQRIGDHKIGFLVADVSGKGVSAALFASRAHTLCAPSNGLAAKGPAAILTAANKELCTNNDSLMFVTLWMGELDLRTGLLRYCNAGHNPPLLRRCADAKVSCEYLRERSGLMLGVFPDETYLEFQLQMNPGDALLLYTDGVTECINGSKEEYGEDRLRRFVGDQGKEGCHELVDALRADIREFSQGAEQFDDITLLAVRLKGLHQAQEPKQISCQTRFFAASDDNLEEMKGFLRGELGKADVDSDCAEMMVICMEELFANVNHYAYGKQGGALCMKIWSEADGRVSGTGANDKGTLHLEIMDSGIPFNPFEDAPAPNLGPAAERPLGGMGIFMVSQVMDKVSYRFESGCNVVSLEKRL